MRRLAIAAVLVSALVAPGAARAQNLTLYNFDEAPSAIRPKLQPIRMSGSCGLSQEPCWFLRAIPRSRRASDS